MADTSPRFRRCIHRRPPKYFPGIQPRFFPVPPSWYPVSNSPFRSFPYSPLTFFQNQISDKIRISSACVHYTPTRPIPQSDISKRASENSWFQHPSVKFLSSGIETRIKVPCPGLLCKSIFPFKYCTACFTMESPNPVPPDSLERLLSTR